MNQALALVCVVVLEYDEAIRFFVDTLGFHLIEDTYIPEQDKRWVVVKPPGTGGANLLLARASTEEQRTRAGNQTGGRVFLFLFTDDLRRDYEQFKSRGVKFIREPERQAHGLVAVFADLYGNAWDLIQPNERNGSWQR